MYYVAKHPGLELPMVQRGLTKPVLNEYHLLLYSGYICLSLSLSLWEVAVDKKKKILFQQACDTNVFLVRARSLS